MFHEKREMGKRHIKGGCKQERCGTACRADKPLRREPSRCIMSYQGYAEGYPGSLSSVITARDLGEGSGVGVEGEGKGEWET